MLYSTYDKNDKTEKPIKPEKLTVMLFRLPKPGICIPYGSASDSESLRSL